MKVLLQEMTYPEVARKVKEGAPVIIPMGSTEQHARHLPLGTDFFIALELSKLVAEKAGCVVAPILWVGFSKEHMAFKGTITLEVETLVRVLQDAIRSLLSHGFKKIIVLNAHGGNDVILRSVVLDANLSLDVDVLYIGLDELLSLMPERYRDEVASKMDFHAGVLETSLINLIRPELVRVDEAVKPNVSLGESAMRLLEVLKGNPELTARMLASTLTRFDKLSDTGALTLADPSKPWGRQETSEALEEVAVKIKEIIDAWK